MYRGHIYKSRLIKTHILYLSRITGSATPHEFTLLHLISMIKNKERYTLFSLGSNTFFSLFGPFGRKITVHDIS